VIPMKLLLCSLGSPLLVMLLIANTTDSTGSSTTGITISNQGHAASGGSGTGYAQPTMLLNKILRIFWLLERDIDPASNDNAPAFMAKVA
jgi:hypothetical protein